MVNKLVAMSGGIILPPASATFLQRLSLTADQNIYTFTAANLGAAAADRAIVVGVGTFSDFAQLNVVGMTINGVAATFLARADVYKETNRVELWAAFVPSGTSGDVVVDLTGSGNALNMSVCMYRVLGLTSLVPLATLSRANGTSVALTTRADGVAIGTAFSNDLAAGFATTGFTENADAVVETTPWGDNRVACGLISPTVAGSPSVGFAGAADICWVGASW